MTEASPIVFLSNVDESEHKSLTTIGQVLDHSEVSFRWKINIDMLLILFVIRFADISCSPWVIAHIRKK